MLFRSVMNKFISKYDKIYLILKDEIKTKKLSYGQKLLSIRKCSEMYGVSRTTIENTYYKLVFEGFVESRPGSGYYVTYNTKKILKKLKPIKKSHYLYDFTNDAPDYDLIDIDNWAKLIKSILYKTEKISSYGQGQGEVDLRQSICNFVYQTIKQTDNHTKVYGKKVIVFVNMKKTRHKYKLRI